MRPSEPELPAGRVRLYHGTTDRAAERILNSGFRALDFHGLVDGIAQEHGVSVHDLLEAAHPTFLVDADRRDEDFVSFGGSAMRVEFWARIGGEARWEALRAAYVVQHPESHMEDPAAYAWVDGLLRGSHVPTVVTLDVPYDDYRARVRTAPPSYEEWASQPEWRRDTGIEWLRLPIPVAWISGSFPIEEALTAFDVAQVLGTTWSGVYELIRSGGLPASDNVPIEEAKWWRSTLVEAGVIPGAG